MQKLKLLLPLALFLGAFFVACHDDDFSSQEKQASVTFAGQIIDEYGIGVQGALVKAGEKSIFTDRNGIFRLEMVSLPANHAILSVTGAGFFDFSRAYVVQDHALQTVTIQLLSKEIAGLVNANSGGVVNVTGGPKLSFPANAITDENGNAYSGTVQVLAKYIDPIGIDLGLHMPGNLTGLNLAGERQSLSTYGMIGVELVSPSGQKLKIADNQEVEVRVPIDASIAATAPSEIPLWHYDLGKAYWIEEGVAQKIGNEYVGKVKHFSYWNYDGSLPSVNVYGKVYLGDTDHPLANVQVSISPADPASGWSCGHGNTDGNGCFGGAASKDLPLKIEIVWWGGGCGLQTIYSALIGPFSADVTLPPIILPNQAVESILVSGRLLDCNGQALTNGYVKVTSGLTSNYIFTDNTGNFEYNALFCTSNGTQTGTIVGYDLANLLESSATSFSVPPNMVNVGDITVCNVLSEYIRYTLDGAPEIVRISPNGGSDGTTTYIGSVDSTQMDQSISLSFMNSGQTGTFQLTNLNASLVSANLQAVNTLSATLSSFGNIGDLMIGSFGGNFQDYNGNNHTISGSYRVIRTW